MRGNYIGNTRTALDQLVPSKAGEVPQLHLWHGVPGTGKTHAIRALAWEWRAWCDPHCIVDPEAFFGDSSYMLKTLMGPGSERWRLFIAEDTGELLSKDAKMRTGQGLSRLLNVVDGLIGQGLRIMVLITTNERLESLHEAVVRPGRCSGPIEFEPFAVGAANEWLAAQGKPPVKGSRARTLAELYAGAEPQKRNVAAGFGGTDVAGSMTVRNYHDGFRAYRGKGVRNGQR